MKQMHLLDLHLAAFEQQRKWKMESGNTKEQAEKFQRVSANIYKELAELKSRKGK